MDSARSKAVPPSSPSPARVAATERAASRLAHLQEQLAAARHQERLARERQAAIVGRALMIAMQADATLRAAVLDVLRRAVTRPADRAEIAPLLIGPTP